MKLATQKQLEMISDSDLQGYLAYLAANKAPQAVIDAAKQRKAVDAAPSAPAFLADNEETGVVRSNGKKAKRTQAMVKKEIEAMDVHVMVNGKRINPKIYTSPVKDDGKRKSGGNVNAGIYEREYVVDGYPGLFMLSMNFTAKGSGELPE